MRYLSLDTHSFLQFKTNFEAKQESASGYVYSDEIMGVSGVSAIGGFFFIRFNLVFFTAWTQGSSTDCRWAPFAAA
jgi:hypothetical protein